MTNQRIAANTIATYTRSVFSVGLALFSSRWVLNALGQTDYGLFSVVGSIIVFITFLNSLMANSAARYYAYHIGQCDSTEVNRWFNTALSIHLCLAVLLIFIGWPVGEYVVAHVLTVPDGRVAACLWVFRISLISAFASMLSVPFVAMFTAKQLITELAAWGILQSTLTFTLAWLLRHASGDRLLFYATGMVIILVFVQSALIFRAMIVFNECKIICRQWLDCHRFKGILSFTTWNLIGWTGVLFRDQGSAILLNLFFGPSVNAAYGIASQVSSQTNQLSSAMVGAFSPEITASEGRGDRARMLALSQRAGKFGTILVLLLAVPLIAEMDYVLKLWLRVPPPYTALFCQLMLGTFLIDRLSTGYILAAQAHGKIAVYQVIVGMSLLLTLPLAWTLLKFGFAPTSIGIAFIATMILTALGRVLWGRHLLGMPISRWWTAVVLPSILVALIATATALTVSWTLPYSFRRLIFVTAASTAATLVTTWFLALDFKERKFIGQNVRRVFNKYAED